MRLAVILISALALSACSKRIVDLQASSHQTRIDKVLDSSKLVQVNTKLESLRLTISDSEADYYIEITPGDDPVQYTPETGFTGKAKSIRITGKSKLKTFDQDAKAENRDSTSLDEVKSKISTQTEDSTEQKNIKRSGTSWLMVVIYMVIAIIVIWLILRFLSR